MQFAKKNYPLLICELANCHGGDYEYLSKTIAAFKNITYPRKAIKLQIFSADTIALPDYEWYKVYEELVFSPSQWQAVIADCAAAGDVWVDLFDLYGVQVVSDNMSSVTGLKLQASVLENLEVINALRLLDLSNKTLMVNVSGYAIDHVERIHACFADICSSLVLQIGYQAYPTSIEHTALQKIPLLKQRFPISQVAMADHADATSEFAQLVPLYASLLGCTHIEKHFCVDRATARYDAVSALEPDEMQRLADRLIEATIAFGEEFISASEADYLQHSIQVPVLSDSVDEGALLKLSDLRFRRTSQTGMTWPDIMAAQCDRLLFAGTVEAGKTVNRGDLRPASIAVIVACRMKSTRLKQKAIVPLAGSPAIERCLNQCEAASGISKVILATSDLDEDALLENFLAGGANLWRGDPEDVIARYLGACDRYGIDVVVRATGDCPIISYEIIEFLLNQHFAAGADYTAAKEFAVGTATEIINVAALRKVQAHFGKAEMSEYMTWYFRNNADMFDVNIVDLPPHMIRDYRLTLDVPEDRDMFDALFTGLGPDRAHYSLDEVFNYLDANPQIASINRHVELKYVVDKDLIATLDRKTRMKA